MCILLIFTTTVSIAGLYDGNENLYPKHSLVIDTGLLSTVNENGHIHYLLYVIKEKNGKSVAISKV